MNQTENDTTQQEQQIALGNFQRTEDGNFVYDPKKQDHQDIDGVLAIRVEELKYPDRLFSKRYIQDPNTPDIIECEKHYVVRSKHLKKEAREYDVDIPFTEGILKRYLPTTAYHGDDIIRQATFDAFIEQANKNGDGKIEGLLKTPLGDLINSMNDKLSLIKTSITSPAGLDLFLKSLQSTFAMSYATLWRSLTNSGDRLTDFGMMLDKGDPGEIKDLSVKEKLETYSKEELVDLVLLREREILERHTAQFSDKLHSMRIPLPAQYDAFATEYQTKDLLKGMRTDSMLCMPNDTARFLEASIKIVTNQLESFKAGLQSVEEQRQKGIAYEDMKIMDKAFNKSILDQRIEDFEPIAKYLKKHRDLKFYIVSHLRPDLLSSALQAKIPTCNIALFEGATSIFNQFLIGAVPLDNEQKQYLVAFSHAIKLSSLGNIFAILQIHSDRLDEFYDITLKVSEGGIFDDEERSRLVEFYNIILKVIGIIKNELASVTMLRKIAADNIDEIEEEIDQAMIPVSSLFNQDPEYAGQFDNRWYFILRCIMSEPSEKEIQELKRKKAFEIVMREHENEMQALKNKKKKLEKFVEKILEKLGIDEEHLESLVRADLANESNVSTFKTLISWKEGLYTMEPIDFVQWSISQQATIARYLVKPAATLTESIMLEELYRKRRALYDNYNSKVKVLKLKLDAPLEPQMEALKRITRVEFDGTEIKLDQEWYNFEGSVLLLHLQDEDQEWLDNVVNRRLLYAFIDQEAEHCKFSNQKTGGSDVGAIWLRDSAKPLPEEMRRAHENHPNAEAGNPLPFVTYVVSAGEEIPEDVVDALSKSGKREFKTMEIDYECVDSQSTLRNYIESFCEKALASKYTLGGNDELEEIKARLISQQKEKEALEA